MSSNNPYQSGSANPLFHDQGEAVSAMVITQLVRTRRWVRLCSVIGFIGAAFMLLAGVVMTFAGAAGASAIAGPKSAAYNAGVFGSMGVAYLLFSFIYIYPSLKLWQYASGITRLETSQQTIDLETALDKQRSFWKFVGLMITIMLLLYAVGIGLMIIFAVVAGAAM